MTASSLGALATTGAAATASAANASASTNVLGNLSTFLTILTTQLTKQDPTSATDTNQFTQELVEFAGVEQQLNTNSDLTQLINLQQTSGGLSSTLNYIGQYAAVTTSNNQMVLQNGNAEIGYYLNQQSTGSNIEISNSAGTVVATVTGSGNPGLNFATWDGQSSTGTQLADGTYTAKIVGNNADGTTQAPAATFTIGKVTGVTTNSNGTFNVQIGNGLSVLSSQVDAVYAAGNLPVATTNN